MSEETIRLNEFSFGEISVKWVAPSLDTLRSRFDIDAKTNQTTSFPYWAKLWPSAIAMCRFIAANARLLADKKVLELAAGLGLPGIVAAHLANEVILSDYAAAAVEMMQASVDLNSLKNVTCRQLDWSDLPENLCADVLLLSDINYDPTAFDTLYQVLSDFLHEGTTIILSTPQRLMARPFVERLLKWVVQQEEQLIELDGERTFISIFVLQQSTE